MPGASIAIWLIAMIYLKLCGEATHRQSRAATCMQRRPATAATASRRGAETTKEGATVGSGGGCADDIPADDTPGWCYVIPETCTSPPQRRHGIPWDICVGVFPHTRQSLSRPVPRDARRAARDPDPSRGPCCAQCVRQPAPLQRHHAWHGPPVLEHPDSPFGFFLSCLTWSRSYRNCKKVKRAERYERARIYSPKIAQQRCNAIDEHPNSPADSSDGSRGNWHVMWWDQLQRKPRVP